MTGSAAWPPAALGAPLHEPEQFAPGHFWTMRETPYEFTITCQCGWGWKWNQPWGSRSAGIASYYDHARTIALWTPDKRLTGEER